MTNSSSQQTKPVIQKPQTPKPVPPATVSIRDGSGIRVIEKAK
jgi:hypothetical protein